MADPGAGLAPWSDASYIRVYTTLSRDHLQVWISDPLLAWYVRLLQRANAAWPGLADLPRSIPDDVVSDLVAEQVIDVVGDHLYRFHGLDLERNGQRRRGQRGGFVRASSAARDPLGRFAGGSIGDAGLELDRSLDASAGDDRWTSSDPALRNETLEQTPSKASVPSAAATTPARAPAPAREDPGKRHGEPGVPMPLASRDDPTLHSIDCSDYQAHIPDHRWFDGIGWKCLACEQVRAQGEPTFSEKVQAQGGDPF